MKGRIDLCVNCLESDARAVTVGPDRGTQRDPWRETIPLCGTCSSALLDGDFRTLRDRYRDSRGINIGRSEDSKPIEKLKDRG